MNPRVYADAIEKNLGTQKAFEIAKEARETTKIENWANLPIGEVFHDKTDGGKWVLRDRPLRKLSAFWDNVFGILRKRAISKGVKV